MTPENNLIKTVIVIGAGASKDFALKQCLNEKDGEFLERQKEVKINMPTGEELVRIMAEFSESNKFFDEENKIIDTYRIYEITHSKAPILEKYLEAKRFYEQNFNLNWLVATFEDNQKSQFEILLIKIKPIASLFKSDRNNIINYINQSRYPAEQTLVRVGSQVKNPISLKFQDVIEKISLLRNEDFEQQNFLILETTFHHFFYHPLVEQVLKNSTKTNRAEYFKHHLKLAKLLKFYDPTSIDNFLNSIERSLISINIGDETNTKNPLSAEQEKEERKNLVIAGKQLIAFYLLRAENKEIFNSDNKIWYRWLREALINGHSPSKKEKPEKIILNKINSLKIISFNYDRSLSFFIEEKMNYNFIVDRKKINLAKKLKEKIYYPYGCLDEKKKGQESFEEIGYGEFSKKLNEHSLQDFFEKYIKHYAERIYTIHEERRGENNVKLEIDNSCRGFGFRQNFYFLGFGFIQENIAQITNPERKAELSGRRSIFYTNFGNSKKIEDLMRHSFVIEDIYNPLIQQPSPKGVFDAINEDFPLIIEP